MALSLTIEHALPGRLRLRLSSRLADPSLLIQHVRHHDGVLDVAYTPLTGSVLVRSEPDTVSREEIVLRVALAMSLDHGDEPVRVHSDPLPPRMAPSTAVSGLSLLAAGIARTSGTPGAVSAADLGAGLATAWAVLDHAWGEIREQGSFDPEVASVFFLVAAMVRGNTLPAALLTWFSTFGRHLVEAPRSAVEVRPMRLGNATDGPRYEISVNPVRVEAQGVPLLRLLPSLAWYAFTGARGGLAGGLIDQMREVSKLHNQMLEGLSSGPDGFPLRIR
jgi:hypothetical protein